MRVTRRTFIKKSLYFTTVAYSSSQLIPLLSGCDSSDINKKWQIGIFTRPWAKYDYLTALDAITEAGYRYVGLMSAENGLVISAETTIEQAKKIGREIRDRKLILLSVFAGNFEVEKSLEHGVQILRKLIDNCSAAGSQSLLLVGTANAEIFDNYYMAVTRCCDYAMEKGIMMTLKPHGGLNADGRQLATISQRINHPNFQIFYDPGNIYYYSDGTVDPLDDVPAICDQVVGMCVKDYVHPKNVMITPGEGMVKFPELFTKMYNLGFQDGPLIVECLKESTDLKELSQEAIEAREFLESLLKNLE